MRSESDKFTERVWGLCRPIVPVLIERDAARCSISKSAWVRQAIDEKLRAAGLDPMVTEAAG